MTHYIPAYAPLSGVRERAICGRYVVPADHALVPMCAECKTLIAAEEAKDAQDAAAIAELQAMEPGPQFSGSSFDILDGYRRKGGR